MRKRNRLENYDYSLAGAYFVTICSYSREKIFGNIVGEDIILPTTVQLTPAGKIVENSIKEINSHYPSVTVDKYVIMPNHIHLILVIGPDENGRIISSPTLSTVVGQMKRASAKNIGRKVWQRSFHDHVIRNEHDYMEIWHYIDINPRKWRDDHFYVE